MPQDQKKIYLTFDDGPTPDITLWTLKLLKEYHAKATFFCIGNNIEKHPEIFDAIIRDGHTVGNHTYAHPKGWTTNKDTYVDQVIQTQDLIDYRIENFNIQSPNPKSERQKLFRPPYGQITGQQGKHLLALDYTIIMWDILAFDWKDSISEEQCAKNVISKTRPGSIIVFHDSVKAAKNMMFALPKVLQHFHEAGFEFERL